MLRSGVRAGDRDILNVIPTDAECGFDIRISPLMDPDDIVQKLNAWCEECTLPGGKITWDLIGTPLRNHSITSLDPQENPWWEIFRTTIEDDLHIKLSPSVFPAATDSRFLRALGIRAIGFSPIRNSPILLHEHNEYIDEDVFIEGCEVFTYLMYKVTSQGLFAGDSWYYANGQQVDKRQQAPINKATHLATAEPTNGEQQV